MEEQIATEQYPIGSWLPSVRALASEVGVNRNTVSKVYQALARDGTVRTMQGRGVVVAAMPPMTPDVGAHLIGSLESVVRDALLSGFSEEWLLAAVRKAVSTIENVPRLRMAFIECTEHETQVLSQDLSRHLAIDVDPIPLSSLERTPDVVTKFDWISTTMYHLQEVAASVAAYGTEVVPIHHTVSHRTVLEVASLEPDITIAIVAPNDRSLHRVEQIVSTFARGTIRPVVADSATTVDVALRGADAVVDMSMTHDLVLQLRPELPSITVEFHIEEQSIRQLQQLVRERITKLSCTPRPTASDGSRAG